VRGLGGFAVSVAGISVAMPALAGAAAAQPSSTTTIGGQGPTSGTTVAGVTTTGSPTTTSPAAATTTTTSPPDKPQPTDLVFLSFAQSVELAAVQAYGVALSSTLLGDAVAEPARAFQRHHLDHAQAFAGMAGKTATGVANQSLLAAFGTELQGAANEGQLVRAMFAIEMAAAATYTAGLAQILGTDPASLVASILPIESRHAVVLGAALNLDVNEYSPVFEPVTGALTPEQYPILER